jgi:hypothetical protein
LCSLFAHVECFLNGEAAAKVALLAALYFRALLNQVINQFAQTSLFVNAITIFYGQSG